MIWECTVCTNHFDGPSPPDGCHSCGSPREYFTAYHYYGLGTATGDHHAPTSAIVRPSYTESSVEAVTCFRFHDAQHFQSAPKDFYRNFLETRRTFFARHRFAGKGWNSGFYFAMDMDSAIAEKLYYSKILWDQRLSEPQTVLRKLQSLGKDYIFLEVTLALQRVADLTDPIVLEYFLREGPARAEFQPSGVPYAIARTIMPSDEGGSRHTDGIGYHACSNGWNAVKFPSVRALSATWGIENLSRWDIVKKTTLDRLRGSEESVVDSLRNQAIVVAFSGSLLTRSISQYTWMDANASKNTALNPYFGVDSKTLETVRINFRKLNELTPVEAADQGYLSDEEIIEEFTPSGIMWVKRRENL